MMMTARAEPNNANFEVDVKLTLLRLSISDPLELPCIFSLFSGLAIYFSSMLFGGEECDELESEVGG